MTDYEENAELETTEIGGAPPEDNSNRNFLIVAGVLGGIMLLTLVCIAIFGAVYLPRAQSAQKTAAAEVNAQNTAVALSVQQTDQAAKLPPTSTATTPPTHTSVPTNTQVVKPVTTSTATSVADPFTATAEALSKTLAAQQSKTLPPTSTALPTSGFADEVGLPGLFALAGALLVIILVARRLRAA